MGKRFEMDTKAKSGSDSSLELKKGSGPSRRFDMDSEGKPVHRLEQPLLFSRKATATLLVCLALTGLLLVTLGIMTGYKLGNRQRQGAEEFFVTLQGGSSDSQDMADAQGRGGMDSGDVDSDDEEDPDRIVVAPLPEADETMQQDQADAGTDTAASQGAEEPEVDWSGFTGDMVQTPEEAAAPETYPLTVYTVQVGAFAVEANAREFEAKLVAKGYQAFTHVDEGGNRTMHYVRFGEFQTREEADAAAEQYESAEGTAAMVMVGESRRRAVDPVGSTAFSVQVGSFPDAASAELHARDLAARGLSPCVIRMFGSDGRTWFDVQLAQFPTREAAEAFALEFRDREGIPSNVRSLDAGLLEERKTCLE